MAPNNANIKPIDVLLPFEPMLNSKKITTNWLINTNSIHPIFSAELGGLVVGFTEFGILP
jgi:hypothetical protein